MARQPGDDELLSSHTAAGQSFYFGKILRQALEAKLAQVHEALQLRGVFLADYGQARLEVDDCGVRERDGAVDASFSGSVNLRLALMEAGRAAAATATRP